MFKKLEKKRVIFTRTTNIPIEFLTEGYLDSRHLFSCMKKGLRKKPNITSYTKSMPDLESTLLKISRIGRIVKLKMHTLLSLFHKHSFMLIIEGRILDYLLFDSIKD